MIVELLQILVTVFVFTLVPIYLKNYGAKNFLWLSDIGLFLTLFALWFKSSFFISMAVIGILPLEILWNVDFFIHLITGYSLCGLSSYMFDKRYNFKLRCVSLFHIFMPPIWIFLLIKWGYNIFAFKAFLLLYWLILICTYLFTDPQENINWVFLPTKYKVKWMPNLIWLIILIFAVPIFIFLPIHLFLVKIIF